jgi:predicted RNase H-like HicB family nuclease
MWEAMENLDEVLFYGAEGTLVEPKWKAKFGAQILLCSEWALDRWQPIRFPEDIREYLKIYNHCRIDTKGDGGIVDFFIPQIAKMKQIGSVVALGDTPEEAVDKCKEIAEQVRGFDLESEADSLDKCVEEMEEEPAEA